MVLHSNDLGRRVVSGATYTFLGIFLRTAMTIGSTAVLARLLTPADFGYIAMATVVTELAALFGNFGFGAVLTQRRIVARLHLDTVFWASAAVGAALTAIVFSLSFVSDWLFSGPYTGDLLRLLCVTFLIGSFTVIPNAILARLMQFRTTFWIQMGTIAVRTLVAIAFALEGYGVWSLVAGSIAGSLANLLGCVALVPYVPRLRFNTVYLKSIRRASGSYFGGGILFYINANVDLFLIGRELGAATLGLYQNARSLTDEVRSRIAIPLQHVLFPAFSAIQGDRERTQQSVIRSGRLLAAVIFPVAVGISSVAEELVPVLYGPQWLMMIPVLKTLGLSAAVRGSSAIVTPVFNAHNRPDLALKYNTVASVLMILAVVFTIPHGIEAVATAIAITSLYSLVTLRVGLGLIGLRANALAKMLAAPTLASAVMWVGIASIRGLDSFWSSSSGLELPVHVLSGALIYSLTLIAISPKYLTDFKVLATKLGARR